MGIVEYSFQTYKFSLFYLHNYTRKRTANIDMAYYARLMVVHDGELGERVLSQFYWPVNVALKSEYYRSSSCLFLEYICSQRKSMRPW